MTEYRELHPIGTAARIEALLRERDELARLLYRLRSRRRSIQRLKSLERENKMLKRQIDGGFTPGYDLRRGFIIPDHLRQEYRKLTRVKRIRAHEAGRMLGLI